MDPPSPHETGSRSLPVAPGGFTNGAAPGPITDSNIPATASYPTGSTTFNGGAYSSGRRRAESGPANPSSDHPKIDAIVYAEFHTTQGPQIVYSYPKTLPEDTLKQVELDYLIPKPAICGRVLCFGSTVGFPVRIQSSTYDRNAFIFNMAFVLASEPTLPLKRLASILGRHLTDMETQWQFLSKQKPRLKGIMREMYNDLNRFGECSIYIEDYLTINLSLSKVFPQTLPETIADEAVPIFTRPIPTGSSESWDKTLVKVLPLINGVNHVRRIAEMAHVDVRLLKAVLQHFMYGVVYHGSLPFGFKLLCSNAWKRSMLSGSPNNFASLIYSSTATNTFQPQHMTLLRPKICAGKFSAPFAMA